MKKYIGTALLVFLVACGQGESEDNQESASLAADSTNNPENSIEDDENEPATVDSTEFPDNSLATTSLEIPADNRDTAAELIHQFVAEELTSDEYGDFYFEFTKPERMGEPVLLVTADVNDVAEALADFAESNSDSTSTQTVHIDQVTYSISHLNNARDLFIENYPAFFENEDAFSSISVNVVANRLDISVRTIEEVNMDALKEAFGQTDFITFHESAIGDMTDDEVPIPTADPEITGSIAKIEEGSILIDNEIYLIITDTVIVDSTGAITANELQLGDRIHAWTNGPSLLPKPAQGAAVFIQRIDKESAPTNSSDNIIGTTSLEIPADNLDDAVDLMHDFVAEELTLDEYGDFYYEFTKPERIGEPVLLVTSDANNVAEALATFAESNSNSTSTQTIHVDQVTYSMSHLFSSMERITDNRPAFFENENALLEISIDIVTNTVHLHVRTKDEVNMDALKETFGQTDFLTFTETPIADMTEDQIPTPTAEPEFIGYIEEMGESEILGNFILIDQQVYLSTLDAVVVDSTGTITADDLQLGDRIHAWTTGSVMDSDPMQGFAVFIKRMDD